MSARPRLALESIRPSRAASPVIAIAVAAGDHIATGITETVLRVRRTAIPSPAFEPIMVKQCTDSQAQEG